MISTPMRSFTRRSTARLMLDLERVKRAECHCDSYVGFECGKHHRRALIELELERRGKLPGPEAEGSNDG